ncbi:MAG: AarF/ABC1/UbiB kinase family protein [Candidatus Thermoplasmatota archaeon]|jgi:predicted unusual protein kinase regulating ubiquinone biosynthesis (AarF/ABC1/UbiB family)|nr:AarF/ABC1/UbiB kinase family protein [Candidatus Thermoplasmatota archaeon]MCL5785973.1 AarF/ABC1/UbiB kinase family protein [Candidatus Thermoplasmatota archaeon]
MEPVPLRGIRLKELRVVLRLYPVYRRFRRDRDLARRSKEREWDHGMQSNGKRAVDTFISLGPTFVKLGQILSARADILPKEYLVEFQRLQDDVPPAPFRVVKPIIERNVGILAEVFDEFDEEAISGASLGQVYLARHKGKKVAVKVNRPNIREVLTLDLAVITRLLKFGSKRLDKFLYLSISNVVEEFKKRVYDEIDYRKEASNIERIRKNISGREKVAIPHVVDDMSTSEVLTMEFLDGTKITDVDSLKKKGIDLPGIAFRVDLMFVRMLLRDDIFHADPHPGNISVLDDGTLVLYDFGMVGSLDANTRYSLMLLYLGLMDTDPDVIMDALYKLNALSPAANRGVIRKGIEYSLMSLKGVTPEEMEIRELLDVANEVIFEFPFRLPRSLVLYMRMSSLLEGVCLTLDSNFRFVKVLRTLLQDEGLLNELYSRQLSEFVKKAVVSVEKGLDVLPLLKRTLEEGDSNSSRMDQRSYAGEIFLGLALIGGVYLYVHQPVPGILAIAVDLIASAVYFVRKRSIRS